jgi:hypothetical protein
MPGFLVRHPHLGILKTDLTGTVRSTPCQQENDNLAHNRVLFHRDCNYLFRFFHQNPTAIRNFTVLSRCDQPGLQCNPSPHCEPDLH